MTAKIKLNAASGGGSFSLQAPSSSANTRVMTLPDSADGTILTTTNPKSGGIIKVVKTNVTASSSYGSSANSHYTLTPLNTTIVPVGTNSHFIISGQVSGEANANANANIFLRLIRNTTSGFADGNNVAIAVGDNGSNNTAPENTSAFHGYYNQNNDSTISTSHISPYVDSPGIAAGGNLQYKVQIYIQVGSTTFYMNRTVTEYNETYGDYLPSWLTVMEVAA